MKQSSF